MGQHSTLTDEHLSLESNNGGTEEREAINVNSKCFKDVEMDN